MTPAAPQQLTASAQPTTVVHTPASAVRAVTLLQSMAAAGALGAASAVVLGTINAITARDRHRGHSPIRRRLSGLEHRQMS